MCVVALGVAGAVQAGIATYVTELSDLREEKERVETIEQGQTFSSLEITRSSRFSRSYVVQFVDLNGATVKENFIRQKFYSFFFSYAVFSSYVLPRVRVVLL